MLAAFTVTNPNALGEGSLRDAIAMANAMDGPDEINFAEALSGQTITLGGAELLVAEALTIDATALAEPLTIDANQLSRIFGMTAETGDFRLAGLTLAGGRTTGDNAGFNDSTHSGGAVRSFTSGKLTLERCTITGSSTEGDYAGGGAVFAFDVTLIQSTVSECSTAGSFASGGGIWAFSSVRLSQSTVSGNATVGNSSLGGGIYSQGDVNLTQSTISGNSTAGDLADGGGIWAQYVDSIAQSTITGNHATHPNAYGGGLYQYDSAIDFPGVITASIIAGNTAGGVGPDLLSDPDAAPIVNYSLIGDVAGSGVTPQTGVGNLLDVDPGLGPLADNGGPTPTHALLPGSPAIDAIVAPTPVHFYDLDSSFGDAFGGPDLVAMGGALTSGGYDFAANQGLSLSSANIASGEYTIEIGFRFDALSGYQKILDFKNLTVDDGLYTRDRSLVFFGASVSGGVVSSSSFHHLVLTRDEATDVVRAYINGDEAWNFADAFGRAVFSGPESIIHVFRDDDVTAPGEAESGFVSRIRIYDRALDATEVEQLRILTATFPFDQRGEPYLGIVGAAGDIGAFEVQTAPAASADFDADDDVDGHDFLAWQRGLGAATGAAKADGDSDADGDVDQDDLEVWKAQFGAAGPAKAADNQSAIAATMGASTDIAPSAAENAGLDAVYAVGDFSQLFAACREYRPPGRGLWRRGR
jgi:hypothetical protein